MTIQFIKFNWSEEHDKWLLWNIYEFTEVFLKDGKTWPVQVRNQLTNMISECNGTDWKLEIRRFQKIDRRVFSDGNQ